MPYPVMNTLLDAGYPTGALNYWLSSFTSGLPDELIDAMVERFASVPSPMRRCCFEHFHGAVTRIGVTDTAVPHREEGWNLADPVGVDGPRRRPTRTSRWTRETYAALSRPHLDERRWLNYLGDDQGDDAVRARTARTTTGSSSQAPLRPATTSSTTTTTSTPPDRTSGVWRVQSGPDPRCTGLTPRCPFRSQPSRLRPFGSFWRSRRVARQRGRGGIPACPLA